MSVTATTLPSGQDKEQTKKKKFRKTNNTHIYTICVNRNRPACMPMFVVFVIVVVTFTYSFLKQFCSNSHSFSSS